MNNLEVAVTGVKIVAKILDFPAPELYIMEQSKLPNQEITGMYRFKENESERTNEVIRREFVK